MSDQEKKNSSPVVVVEQTESRRHKQPYRPNELEEEAVLDPHHKRSTAPAVTSVADEIKNVNLVTTTENTVQERKESEHGEKTKTSEKHSKLITKKTLSKHHDSLPEEIALAIFDKEPKIVMTTPTQPIPPQVESAATAKGLAAIIKKGESQSEDEDSITPELAETRQKTDWSEDDEAGGLPRSGSRSSRVSRAVRQLLCCGVRHSAPSEEDISTDKFPGI